MMRNIALLLVLVATVGTLFADDVEDVGYIAYLYRLGEARTAMLKIDDFLARYPGSEFAPDVLFMRAGLDLQSGNYRRAQSTYTDLLRGQTDPVTRAETILGQAQCHYFLGQPEQAEQRLREFIRLDPQNALNARAYYFLGKIAMDRGSYEAALEDFETAGRYGDDASIGVARVEALSHLKRYDAAERIIDNLYAAGQSRQADEALLIYHDLNLRLNRPDRVLSYDRIAAGSPYRAEYTAQAAQAEYELGRFSQALAQLNGLSSLTDKARYYRGLCLLALDRETDAAADFRALASGTGDLAVNSSFYLARITARRDPAAGNGMLETFLKQHPDSPMAGAAAYQLGMNLFDAERWNDALDALGRALALNLDDVTREKAEYLRAEALFQSGKRAEATEAMKRYVERYASGRFVDEALFKQGLMAFEDKHYDRAADKFGQLIGQYPNAPKKALAEFYLGEIEFFGSRYAFALQHYHNALAGDCDHGYVHERIARINYQNKDYDQALAEVNLIPDDTRYAYEKQLLKGDILFARKKYDESITAYGAADAAAATAEAHEAARSRLAWTYYQQGKYDRATQIYSELSASSSRPETFLLLAARTAFSANDYLAAAQYYRQYAQDCPHGADYNQAVLGMADSYYNLGNYAKAAGYYRTLIRPGIQADLLDSAMNGLVWSAKQSTEVDLLTELDRLIAQPNGEALRPRLMLRKAEWLLDKKRYDDAGAVCNQIIEGYPRYEQLNRVYGVLAQCYRAQGQAGRAESAYAELNDRTGGKDPDVLFDWALAKLANRDTTGAIAKMGAAASLSRSARIWQGLLKLQVETDNGKFLETWQQFSRFAAERELAEGQLLWIDWQVRHGQAGLADPVLSTLLQSQWRDIRAQAQTWKGRILFERKQYDQAVAELLRVRYLYPEATSALLLADYYACLAWIELGENDKARDRFSAIRDGLSPAQVKTLQQRLGGE